MSSQEFLNEIDNDAFVNAIRHDVKLRVNKETTSDQFWSYVADAAMEYIAWTLATKEKKEVE